jgi:hypothetical protein
VSLRDALADISQQLLARACCENVPEGRRDRSPARSAWESATPTEPSRRVRYDSYRCGHRYDDWNQQDLPWIGGNKRFGGRDPVKRFGGDSRPYLVAHSGLIRVGKNYQGKPGLNGAKSSRIWDASSPRRGTPKGSRGFSPGFQPREHRPTAARPEGAPDQTSPQHRSNVYASLALSGRTICLDGSQG